MRQSRTYRRVWTIAGLLAAGALAVRGIQEAQRGGSWVLLGVALVVMVAVVLRNTLFRDP